MSATVLNVNDLFHARNESVEHMNISRGSEHSSENMQMCLYDSGLICSTTMIGILIFRASADIRVLFRLVDITHVVNPRRLSFASLCGTIAERCSQPHLKLDNDLKIEGNVFDFLVFSFVFSPQTQNDVDYGPLGTIHVESSDCNDDLFIEVEDTSLV